MGEIVDITGESYQNLTEKVVSCINNQGIVIMRSDTVYGFLCKMSLEERVREIKERDAKPFLVLISGYAMLDDLAIDFAPYKEVLEAHWPGPFTFILTDKKGDTHGVRLPAWNILKDIVEQVGQPLLSTSVNISGKPALSKAEDIINTFGQKADLIVVDRDFAEDTASTIVRVDGEGHTVLRQGSSDFTPPSAR